MQKEGLSNNENVIIKVLNFDNIFEIEEGKAYLYLVKLSKGYPVSQRILVGEYHRGELIYLSEFNTKDRYELILVIQSNSKWIEYSKSQLMTDVSNKNYKRLEIYLTSLLFSLSKPFIPPKSSQKSYFSNQIILVQPDIDKRH